MISLLITKIIAPAANARPQGSSGSEMATAVTPRSPPIGSTSPVISATTNACQRG
jgi:hypothetical protein